uniref:WAS/WASL-interacting protein family member 3-like n=1 Tax=Phascolarctos cinereus TaxID=38626 RepID=A0A6P5JT35_PHACI|nr:WAS/WASL-interacting protein family member 3-like [Phascolarctos cinereus]XP_020837261.1 WAS/WASL-interacting protein family member 3-like [Phascolarctos cinereus]
MQLEEEELRRRERASRPREEATGDGALREGEEGAGMHAPPARPGKLWEEETGAVGGDTTGAPPPPTQVAFCSTSQSPSSLPPALPLALPLPLWGQRREARGRAWEWPDARGCRLRLAPYLRCSHCRRRPLRPLPPPSSPSPPPPPLPPLLP